MESATKTNWAGIDWGGKTHALAIVNARGKVVARQDFPHSAEGLDELIAVLADHAPIGGVAIETNRHLVIDKLLEAGLTVYPINPKVSKRWRECVYVDPGKSDGTDGIHLADGLRLYQDKLTALHPDDPLTRQLRALCDDERGFIKDRTAKANGLKACLKEYHPEALGWFNDFTKPTAADFVLAFPTPEALRAASDDKLRKFLYSHNIGLSPVWKKRLASRTTAARWPSDPAIVAAKSRKASALAKQLRTLAGILTSYRQEIEALFGQHIDAEVFASLPGAGVKIAPRMLTHFGSDHTRYSDATGLQALSGTVPITKKSGDGGGPKFRWACQKGFRNTMFLFAFQSITRSLWARAYYDRARQRGKSHPKALRSLGAKWLKIIYRMWVERKPYDERIYIASLIRHQSPLVPYILKAQEEQDVENTKQKA